MISVIIIAKILKENVPEFQDAKSENIYGIE